MKLTQQQVIDILENLVGTRTTIDKLKADVSNALNKPVEIEEHSTNSDEHIEEATDFQLIGEFINEDFLCDFDIYFLKMRQTGFDGSDIYITEVGYEFDDRE